jgi:hypothetical protein
MKIKDVLILIFLGLITYFFKVFAPKGYVFYFEDLLLLLFTIIVVIIMWWYEFIKKRKF